MNPFLHAVRVYYDQKLRENGPTAGGVDWNSTESQEIRFTELLKVCNPDQNFEINDLGCGYGALYQFLINKGFSCTGYYGYDISEEMIAVAKERTRGSTNCQFFASDCPEPRDYTVASGIFNVKLDCTEKLWFGFILETLTIMSKASTIGFAFNMLNLPTDPSFAKPHLYYAQPNFMADYCQKHFGKDVQVLFHPKLYEFTVIIRELGTQS